MTEGRGHEGGEHGAPVTPPVNHELFDQAINGRPQVNDHALDARALEQRQEDLVHAQTVGRETADMYLQRTNQITPAEFKVMSGVLDLCIKTGAFDPQQLAQVQEKIIQRATQQMDPRAAAGLVAVAEKMGSFANA